MEQWRSAAILIFNVSCFVAGEGDERASVHPADDCDRIQTNPPDTHTHLKATKRLLLFDGGASSPSE